MIVHRSIRKTFLAAGFKASEYFDHHVLELGKKYPDSILVLEKRGFTREEIEQGSFLQINVYADDVEAYPEELFFDRQLNWHNQQFGKKGLVGAAGLFFQDPANAFVTIMQSDLLQQIYRVGAYRTYKSRLENRFGSWARISLNAILKSAGERGAKALYMPSSRTIASLLNKKVDPSLFERIYDAPARSLSAQGCDKKGFSYWRIGMESPTLDRTGEYEAARLREPGNGKTQVCVLHDIEQNVDTPVSVSVCERNLERMLDIEKQRHVRGTYNILGEIFPKAVSCITDGHAIGFHSWNHDLKDLGQLPKVRELDLQVKGYRPPKSRVTEELTPYKLSYWNFEWLATSSYSLGREDCFVEREIAHICIDTDDYGLYTGEVNYQRWHDYILEQIRGRQFYAFSVHDCYADLWIDDYDRLLDAICEVAEFRTCEDIAGRLFMAAAH